MHYRLGKHLPKLYYADNDSHYSVFIASFHASFIFLYLLMAFLHFYNIFWFYVIVPIIY